MNNLLNLIKNIMKKKLTPAQIAARLRIGIVVEEKEAKKEKRKSV